MNEETLSVRDNRTGTEYTVPINDGAISAMDLRQIKASEDDFGLMSYGPQLCEHGLMSQSDYVYRRRQRHPQVLRLPDRTTGRELDVPGNRIPDRPGRATD